MQLRFRGTDTDLQQSRNLVVFVTLNVVENKYRSVARWQLRYCLLQSKPVDHRNSPGALERSLDYVGEVAFFACVLQLDPAPSKMHQHLIDGQPMKPSRKS